MIGAEQRDDIEDAVEAEGWTGRLRALECESIGQIRICKPQSELVLQQIAVQPADRDVLRVGGDEPRVTASLKQAAATHREAAVTNLTTLVELGPPSADIIGGA